MKQINKQEAFKRLKVIEKEVEELKNIIDKEKEMSWQDVVDFESACKYLGINADDKINKWKYADLTLAQINGLMLEVCIQAVNTENGKRWLPNWSNNESKWLPRFYLSGSSGCVVIDFYDWGSLAGIGFGSYYQSKEKAEHGVKFFKKYYDIWLG